MPVLGSTTISCIGPGEEATPSPTAMTRSSKPTIFQSKITGRDRPALPAASQATGSAVSPTRMSPHPATGAKGAGKRCIW